MLPEEVRQLTQIKLQVLRTGKGVRIELKTTSRAGTCTHDLTVEPLRDSADTMYGVTVCQDKVLPPGLLYQRQNEKRFLQFVW